MYLGALRAPLAQKMRAAPTGAGDADGEALAPHPPSSPTTASTASSRSTYPRPSISLPSLGTRCAGRSRQWLGAVPAGTYLGRVSWLPMYGVIIRVPRRGASAEGHEGRSAAGHRSAGGSAPRCGPPRHSGSRAPLAWTPLSLSSGPRGAVRSLATGQGLGRRAEYGGPAPPSGAVALADALGPNASCQWLLMPTLLI